MLTKPPDKGSTTLDKVKSLLEALRDVATDGEAMAHGAADCLQRMPYIPRTQRMEDDGVDIRLELGRLHTYVYAAARVARELLEAIDHILDVAHGRVDDEGSGGNGDGSNGNGNGDQGEGSDPGADEDNGADNGPGTPSVHPPEGVRSQRTSARKHGAAQRTQRTHSSPRPHRSDSRGSRTAHSPAFLS